MTHQLTHLLIRGLVYEFTRNVDKFQPYLTEAVDGGSIPPEHVDGSGLPMDGASPLGKTP